MTQLNNGPEKGARSMAVFLSLRPETFYRSKEKGTLAAYEPRAFTIAPPRVDRVIEKRLAYAIKLAQDGKLSSSLGDISVESATLCVYLKILLASFTNMRDNRLIEFVDNVCGGNIRLALDFIRSFIGSGHVDTRKILHQYKDRGSYLVPLHEFLRAVVFGDKAYYDPSTSPIVNVFDIFSLVGKEHFLLSLIIAHAHKMGHSASEGYVDAKAIFSAMQDLGFQPMQIDNAIRRAVGKRLLESDLKCPGGIKSVRPMHYRVTSVGVYYVKKMIGTFAYLDAIVVDTPILSEDVRSRIVDTDQIKERISRCRIFLEYLEEQYRLLPKHDACFNWPQLKKNIALDLQRIERTVAGGASRPRPN